MREQQNQQREAPEIERLHAVILAPDGDGSDSEDGADDLIRDVQFYTGASVPRRDYYTGEQYSLTMSMDPAHADLSRLNNGAPLLNNHSTWDLGSVIGVVEPGSAKIVNGKGFAKVRFSNRPNDAELEKIKADVKNGIIRNISMGISVKKLKDITPEDSKQKSYLAIDWYPMELSAVPIGADAGAGFLSHQIVEPQFETRAAARQENSMEPSQTETMAADVVRDQAIQAERRRVTAINAALEKARITDAVFAASLIGGDVTVEAARERILDKLAERFAANPTQSASGSAEVGRDHTETLRLSAENALLHRFRPDEIKLEVGRQFHGMTLLEMAKDFIGRTGKSTKGMPRHEVVQLAFQGTTDFTNILANVANKTLRMGYDAEPQTFGQIAKRGTITDFKPVNRTQIGDVQTLKQLGSSGEYSYTKVTDAKETYSLATYGTIFAVNRQTLINDDLGAFTRIPESLGRAARRMESDIVWGIITANPNMGDGNALFSSAHGNYTGAGTVISINALGVGRKAMRVQTGLNGVGYLNLTPRYLVVPAALETVAQQYTVQTNIVVTQQSNVNPIGPTLIVIPEPRLDANSAVSWYLFADPGMIDTIEYSYLEGQEGVYLETRMGFDVDGMELKAREDFAAKALDWRGIYKNAGA